MAERIAYVGPHQMNFSLPRRLGHKRSVSLLSSHPQSQEPDSPTKPPHRTPYSRSSPNPPFAPIPPRISLPANSPDQPIPPSPASSDFAPTFHFYREPRLRTCSTSTTSSTSDESIPELDELLDMLDLPVPIQFEVQMVEEDIRTELRSQPADVARSHFTPEKVGRPVYSGPRWI